MNKAYTDHCRIRKQVWQINLNEDQRTRHWRYVADDTPVQIAAKFWHSEELPNFHTVIPIRLNLLATPGRYQWSPPVRSSENRVRFDQKEKSQFAISKTELASLSSSTSPAGVKCSALSAYITDPPCKEVKISRAYKVDTIRTLKMLNHKTYKEWIESWEPSTFDHMDKYEAQYKTAKMEHTVTIDSGVKFRDIFAALDQKGKFYYRTWCSQADIGGDNGDTEDQWTMVSKAGITLEEGFAMLRKEQGFEGLHISDELTIEMTGVMIPSECEWLDNGIIMRYGEGPEYHARMKMPAILV